MCAFYNAQGSGKMQTLVEKRGQPKLDDIPLLKEFSAVSATFAKNGCFWSGCLTLV